MMQTKLTLRLDEKLIRRAKSVAKRNGKSVSQMVADYFRLLEKKSEKQELPFTPIVQSLKGSLRESNVDIEDYKRHLEDKYL